MTGVAEAGARFALQAGIRTFNPIRAGDRAGIRRHAKAAAIPIARAVREPA